MLLSGDPCGYCLCPLVRIVSVLLASKRRLLDSTQTPVVKSCFLLASRLLDTLQARTFVRSTSHLTLAWNDERRSTFAQQVMTGAGFPEWRRVRLLLSEDLGQHLVAAGEPPLYPPPAAPQEAAEASAEAAAEVVAGGSRTRDSTTGSLGKEDAAGAGVRGGGGDDDEEEADAIRKANANAKVGKKQLARFPSLCLVFVLAGLSCDWLFSSLGRLFHALCALGGLMGGRGAVFPTAPWVGLACVDHHAERKPALVLLLLFRGRRGGEK